MGRGTKALIELQAHLASKSELDEILGDQGPNLAAEGMHDRVWGAAARLWDDGHPRQAIQAAAQSVESQLQAKIRKADKQGQDLAQAFSIADPTPEWPRLRIPNLEPGSSTFTSVDDGAAFLVRAVFKLIRNLASHEGAPEPEEAEALEQLATLSLLARLVDSCQVLEGGGSASLSVWVLLGVQVRRFVAVGKPVQPPRDHV